MAVSPYRPRSCELLEKRTLTLINDNVYGEIYFTKFVVNCLKREH